MSIIVPAPISAAIFDNNHVITAAVANLNLVRMIAPGSIRGIDITFIKESTAELHGRLAQQHSPCFYVSPSRRGAISFSLQKNISSLVTEAEYLREVPSKVTFTLVSQQCDKLDNFLCIHFLAKS